MSDDTYHPGLPETSAISEPESGRGVIGLNLKSIQSLSECFSVKIERCNIQTSVQSHFTSLYDKDFPSCQLSYVPLVQSLALPPLTIQHSLPAGDRRHLFVLHPQVGLTSTLAKHPHFGVVAIHDLLRCCEKCTFLLTNFLMIISCNERYRSQMANVFHKLGYLEAQIK